MSTPANDTTFDLVMNIAAFLILDPWKLAASPSALLKPPE